MKTAFRLMFAALICVVSFSSPTNAQEKKVNPPKGLEITYDKFRDQTLVRTDRFNLIFNAGEKFICTAFFGYINSEHAPPQIVLVIRPGGTGLIGSMADGLTDMDKVYLSPDSDVIILVGEKRHRLGRVEKDFGLTPSGELRKSVAVAVPLDVVSDLANAKEWEMAVGRLETKINKPLANKLRQRLTSLEAQFRLDTSERNSP